jgi:hypothetical protein
MAWPTNPSIASSDAPLDIPADAANSGTSFPWTVEPRTSWTGTVHAALRDILATDLYEQMRRARAWPNYGTRMRDGEIAGVRPPQPGRSRSFTRQAIADGRGRARRKLSPTPLDRVPAIQLRQRSGSPRG